MPKLYFTRHAEEKFHELEQRGFKISREQVVDIVGKPDLIDYSHFPQFIAQRRIDSAHVLRVVFKIASDSTQTIITFYIGRRKQYEKEITQT